MSPSEALLADAIPARVLERARALRVVISGPAVFEVLGGREPHWVGFMPEPSCDCAQFLLKDAVCKHLVAVLLTLHDLGVTRRTVQSVRRQSAV